MVTALVLAMFLCSLPQGNQQFVWADFPSMREVRGQVVDPTDAIMPNVTVELFDHPEVHTTIYEPRARVPQQKKIAETETNENGNFAFPKIPPGKYEIRFSAPGFKALIMDMKVVRSGRKITKEKLQVHFGRGMVTLSKLRCAARLRAFLSGKRKIVCVVPAHTEQCSGFSGHP